jgi:hypothetical protein
LGDFDTRWLDFAADARNIRLDLATDVFNPYNNMSTNSRYVLASVLAGGNDLRKICRMSVNAELVIKCFAFH